MINRIYAYLALAGGVIVTLLLAFTRGKQSGKQQTEAKQNEQTLDNVAQAKQIENNVTGSDTVTRNRLRTKWTRSD